MIGFSSKRAAKKRLKICIENDRRAFNSERLRQELEAVIEKYAVPDERLRLEIVKKRNEKAYISAKMNVKAIKI